mmetsp:Transcript_961/g.1893  ORF Transcript_961/g.1893 Transcript_961/m.1893 type:complete len:493 (-) Transcript_961:8-1486(-)
MPIVRKRTPTIMTTWSYLLRRPSMRWACLSSLILFGSLYNLKAVQKYQTSSPAPSPAASDDLSACLLIKDDNDRLPEWLAHHFTTGPLRTLIVASDPHSHVFPTEILRRWNGTDGLVIHEWRDEDYIDAGERLQIDETVADVETHGDQAPLRGHQIRQIIFIKRCFWKLREMGRTWTMHIDTDEYLTFNPGSEHEPRPPLLFHPYVEWAVQSNYRLNMDKIKNVRIKQWGAVGQKIEEGALQYDPPLNIDDRYTPAEKNWQRRAEKIAQVRSRLPQVGEMTIMEFIRREKRHVPFVDRHGFFLPRVLFSSKLSNRAVAERGVPPNFDAFRFDTLRFRHHAPMGMMLHNKHGKSFLDVSQLTKESHIYRYMHEHSRSIMNIHNLLVEGRLNEMFLSEEGRKTILPFNSALFRVHHYVGSEESFNAKEDTRRNLDKYSFAGRNSFKILYEDDNLCSWVRAFVSAVGQKKAKYLLAGGGDPALNTKKGMGKKNFF